MQYEVMASSKARAERLKKLRKMAKVPRRQLAECHNISAGTIQNWESNRCGLTEKGARTILGALRKEGVVCSYEWLMLGIGQEPSVQLEGNQAAHTTNDEMATSTITSDLSFYKKLYPHANSLIIKDDSMSPLLYPKDAVVAFKLDCWQEAAGKLCILEFSQGYKLIRFVSRILNKSVRFYAANMTSHAPQLHGESEDVVSVSAVKWHRSAT